ncbi:MAG: HAMP domain-containing histidine kinase [Thermotoga sp.]|nr:HAMP domain-containing histidine kinase [Thermotoga sp.]
MFLSCSKLIVLEGCLLFRRSSRVKWLFDASFAGLLFPLLLRFGIPSYLEAVFLILSLITLFLGQLSPFLLVSVLLYSASSILFYLFREICLYPVAAKSLLLARYFIKAHVEIPRKEIENLSKDLTRIMADVLREEDKEKLRSLPSSFFSKNIPPYLVPLKESPFSFIERYFSFLEEKRKLHKVYIVLVKNLVHDLKNLINTIYVSAQLPKPRYPETSNITINMVRTCFNTLKEIDRILNISIGKSDVVKKKDVEGAVACILDMAKTKRLETTAKLDFDETHVDKEAFLAVVTNLPSNAVKFTSSERILPEVKKKDDRIFLMVSNPELGLKTQSGFELLSVKKLMDYLGGTLALIEKEGTTFKVVIPARRDDDDSADSGG